MEELYDINEAAANDCEDAKSEPLTDTPTADEPELYEDGKAAEAPTSEVNSPEAVDYEALIADDIEALKAEFPELRDITEITDLNNPLRYAALRDLGLSPAEAYMATAKRKSQDSRAHLRSAHGRNAATEAGMMSQYELATARELFPGMSDSDLQRLYKKVTK